MDPDAFAARITPSTLQIGQEFLEADALGARSGMGVSRHDPEDAAWLAMGNKVDDLERYAGPALAAPIVAAWREMSRVHIDTVQELRWARSAVGELRGDYAGACRLVAEMHQAGFGRLTGPVHGDAVEDIRRLGDALRNVSLELVSNPGEPDPIEAVDNLLAARRLLVYIRDAVTIALDGPPPEQPPLDDDPDLQPGVPVADAIQLKADEEAAAKLAPTAAAPVGGAGEDATS